VAAVRGSPPDPWLVVYDAPSRRLAFERAGQRGIERGGVRRIAWDLMLEELNPKLGQQGTIPVAKIRAEIEKSRPADFPAGGPEPGGKAALVAAQGAGDEPWAFIFDATSDRLAAYRAGDGGIELKGVRQLTWDLMLEELDPRRTVGGRVSVAMVRKEMERSGRTPEVQGSPARPREALLAATRGPGGETWVVLFDVATKRLAAYRCSSGGLDLAGLREVRWDLRLEALDPRLVGRRISVVEARALAEKVEAGTGSAKDAGKDEPKAPAKPPPVPASGAIRLAVTQGAGDEPSVFLYDTGSHRVVTYRVSIQGFELRGVRTQEGDLTEDELGPAR
jgi:hypothetical protein